MQAFEDRYLNFVDPDIPRFDLSYIVFPSNIFLVHHLTLDTH